MTYNGKFKRYLPKYRQMTFQELIEAGIYHDVVVTTTPISSSKKS